MASEEQTGKSAVRRRSPVLRKTMSWSPDTWREDVWRRRKGNYGLRRSSSGVTEDDVDELKACIELGFGFEPESSELDPRLSDTLPALGLYCAVHKQYNRALSRSSSSSSILPSPEGGGDSSAAAAAPVVDLGEDPETVKARLRQWAKVVGCSVKQLSGN